ncbi:MAG: YraN family protein [Oscillospiraceae bacterium]
MNTTDTGTWGEEAVAAFLRERGYDIVAGQWRCRYGEIDLIARGGGYLCFVEVKLRSNLSCGLPREFVDARKQKKLRTAAAFYLSTHDPDEPARFDVAEVYTDGGHTATRIAYLEDAFS